MKLICPRCQYKGFVDATAASADEQMSCARCGGPLDELLWSGSQLSSLTTATAATVAVANQRIMENQNAYAPSAETGFEDVLEIPVPLRSAQQHASEQTLVLDDVIPVTELSATDEVIELPVYSADDDDDDIPTLEQEVGPAVDASAALPPESVQLSRPETLVAPEPTSFDYEGYRAWVRVAPLLLLVAALVFFGLYYLGNRVGEGERAQNAATTPATPAETQSAIPATEAEKVESATDASQPSASSADSGTAAGSAAIAEAEPQPEARAENTKVETAKSEPQPTAPAAAPVAAPIVAPSAPVTEQRPTGNFTVQVGSYNNAAQADERAGHLRSSGVEARVVRADIPRRGTWYRVQAGSFASREDAARYAAELKGKGAADDSIITELRGQ
jgi:cell division protein FtsN